MAGRRVSRRAYAVAGVVVTVGVVALTVAIAFGPDQATKQSSEGTSTTESPVRISLRLGQLSATGPGAAATLTNEQGQLILAVVRNYVDSAVVAPLRQGVAGDLSAVFTPAVLPRVLAGDRAVLVDEGLPRAVSVIVVGAPMELTALADFDGSLLLVTAAIDLRITGSMSAKSHVEVRRTGELVLTPDGASWKVSGYDVSVTRSGAGVDPTTTVPATTRR